MRQMTVVGMVLVVAAVGCGGGSGGSDSDPTVKGGASIAVSFSADEPSPGNLTVSMAQASKSGDTVDVAVNVTGTNNVFGADFQVTYDGTRVKYVSYAAGDLLESGCPNVQYLVTPSGSDTILVGISCFGGGTGIDVTSTTDLVHLVFRAKVEGSSRLEFVTPALLDDQNPPQTIVTQPWAGGTFLAN
jgi:hypothetical protein